MRLLVLHKNNIKTCRPSLTIGCSTYHGIPQSTRGTFRKSAQHSFFREFVTKLRHHAGKFPECRLADVGENALKNKVIGDSRISRLRPRRRMATHGEYLHELLSDYQPFRQLRSSSAFLFSKPAVASYFAQRAFSTALHSVWNSLEPDLRSAPSLASFKSRLKTALFSVDYCT